MPEHPTMKVVRRVSVTEPFQVYQHAAVPEVPKQGARVKVHYAGMCYTNKQVQQSGHRRPRMRSVTDTSLYPGYEVSGVIDDICNTIDSEKFKVGDKVIVYPEDDYCDEEGFAEYIIVHDLRNLIHVPDQMCMQVAAMLPTGALSALAAVTRTKPHVNHKIQEREESGDNRPVSILIVGAGALGLWTLILGKYLNSEVDPGKVHIVVADTNMDKLTMAKEQGCSDIAHWEDLAHEEHIVARTKCACRGPVDVIIDFVSSRRSISRAMQVLAKEGILVVGGNSQYEIPFCMRSLAKNQQCIMGVGKGTRQQLAQLVDLVATEKVKPPVHQIFPVEEANSVIQKLDTCKIPGRPILRMSSVEDADEAMG